jgi:hypothetical protein
MKLDTVFIMTILWIYIPIYEGGKIRILRKCFTRIVYYLSPWHRALIYLCIKQLPNSGTAVDMVAYRPYQRERNWENWRDERILYSYKKIVMLVSSRRAWLTLFLVGLPCQALSSIVGLNGKKYITETAVQWLDALHALDKFSFCL